MRFISKNIWLLLSLVIAIWAGRYLLTTSHFYTHDDMQIFRVNEYVKCLVDGQLPCRWSSDLGKGYGYPLFNYYPPVIYFIPSILHLLGLPIILSLNLMSFASFLVAAWGMYALIKTLFKSASLSALGSILYTLYPFHAINVFIRGVYGENLAWSLLPWLLLLILRLLTSKKNSLLLTLLLSSLYLTHLLSSFVVTGVIIFFAIFYLISFGAKQFWQQILQVLGHILISICLSAFFLVPSIAEKNLVQAESLVSGYYAYTNHFVSFFQLFEEYKWNYSASLWSEAWDEMPYMFGHIHSLILAISVFIAFVLCIKKLSNIKKELLTNLFSYSMFGLGLAFLLLAHFKSDPLWQILKPLQYYQFPWRFIGWASLPIILFIISSLSKLPRKLVDYVIPIIAIILILYSQPFFRPRGYDSYTDDDYLEGSQSSEQQVKSLFDYLPRDVMVVPELHAKHSEDATRTSHSYEQIFVLDKDQIISLPVFNYPGWQVYVNGNKIDHSSSEKEGLISFSLPKGTSHVKLVFGNTLVRTIANLISVSTLMVIVIYALIDRVKKKK